MTAATIESVQREIFAHKARGSPVTQNRGGGKQNEPLAARSRLFFSSRCVSRRKQIAGREGRKKKDFSNLYARGALSLPPIIYRLFLSFVALKSPAADAGGRSPVAIA